MEKIAFRLSLISCVCLLIWTSCEEKVLFDFEEQLAAELAQIDNFLARNDIDAENLESYARLNIVDPGNGIIPQDFDTVRYLFSMYDLDSTLLFSNRQEFSSIPDQFWFISDTLDFIAYPGWSDETLRSFDAFGVSMSQEASRIQLFMPSYILTKNLPLPPNQPVMMEFEVVEILR